MKPKRTQQAENQSEKINPAYNNRCREAARLGVSVSTLDRWTRSKIIPAVKHGQIVLFYPADVDAALRGGQA